jgi:phosphoglycerol transferase MdoB-like AlkP superfamily enzyme
MINSLLQKTKPVLFLGVLYLITSLLLRIVFLFHPITSANFTLWESLQLIFVGLFTDVFVFAIASCLLVLYLLFLSDGKYKKPYGAIILGVFVSIFLYILLVPNNIFKQYGGSITEVALIFVGLKTLLFGLLFFAKEKRKNLRNIIYFSTIFIFVLAIIFNTVSEYFFWNEFGVRYNFIAVDYLIYTNEVIGNILESYPIIPLFSVILLFTTAITLFIYKKTKSQLIVLPTFSQKMILLASYIGLFLLSLFIIPKFSEIKTKTVFASEIQANGLPKFYNAFTNNELDFFQFYPTLDQKLAEKVYLQDFNPSTLERNITSDSTEFKKNVVLISIESLSAEFLEHYGSQDKITPFLDSLADKSLMFTNLYATGNRTVRGLEALTLCIPPTAGESIVKRENNTNKFSTGSVFKSKGYQTKFLYGGYSYFDNMKAFFQGNGYDIVDRDNFTPQEITFANVWGVCDEDMAKKAIETMNNEAKSGKPFFNHWMTVSNHRPYTYPEGKIDIPPSSKSRGGGVKYTDYALKKFFEMAKKQSWYSNTVFVIISDHCASSAGKTELPMDKYRIPAMVFSEGFIKPEKFSTLMSQIDVMPTVFSLLNFKYESKFLGQNVFDKNYKPRAYIATYQDLGLIKDDKLTIISPTRNVKQYDLKKSPSNLPVEFQLFYDENLVQKKDENLVQKTISTYQSVSYWVKNNKLNSK